MVTKRIALVFAAALVVSTLDRTPAMALSVTGFDRSAASADGRAQELPPDRSVRRVRTRIEIRPERRFRRECVTTTREIWRPYWGYVVTPDMRCWWIHQ